jgi:hypothetical protein
MQPFSSPKHAKTRHDNENTPAVYVGCQFKKKDQQILDQFHSENSTSAAMDFTMLFAKSSIFMLNFGVVFHSKLKVS